MLLVKLFLFVASPPKKRDMRVNRDVVDEVHEFEGYAVQEWSQLASLTVCLSPVQVTTAEVLAGIQISHCWNLQNLH
jgi:hypothetical protein